ncbi:hypothetical protein [Aquimarina algiphila]|uniref:hypothetical protein n=1 Tax=Aquimarina algiphila TaxID=2047982 RepID=UPI00232AFE71|nr:hypothetical protein [Aquimarina algiphila]
MTARIDLLMDIQAWSYENDYPYLTPLQLICVTCERVAIMHGLDLLREDSDRFIKLSYTLPDHLEDKIQKISKEIKNSNWTRGEYIYNETTKKHDRKPDYKWNQV